MNPRKAEKIVEAEIIKDRVFIWDHELGSQIYSAGFFGKPIGIRKPKPEFFDRPLELSLIEAYYLVKHGKIHVLKKPEQIKLSLDELFTIGKENVPLFEEKVLVYEDIRTKGFVIRPGLKFGADFAVYHQGPGLDHSSYVITTLPRNSKVSAIGLVQAGRLATSVRKKFVIATILPNQTIRYYGFMWYKP
jgi:tRNA-intron endonuclease